MPQTCGRCGGTFEQGASSCHFCGAADEGDGTEPTAKADEDLSNLSSRERARRRLEAEGFIKPPTKGSPLGRIGIGAAVALAVYGFFCPHVTMGLMGGPYKKAVAELASCKAAEDALGDDIHLSWLGFPYGSNHGGTGGFRLPVSGSRSSADLDFRFHGDAVDWTLLVSGHAVTDSKACKAAASGVTPATSASAAKPAPVEKTLRVMTDPLLLDVNKDGHEDAVVVADQSGSPYTYAAVDGMSGKTLWKSQTLENWTDKGFLVGGWLVVVNDAGQLSAFDFSQAKPAWTTTFGERIEQLCEAPDGASVRVDVVGGKSFLVTLATGGQSPSPHKPPCRALLSNRGYVTPYVDRSSGPLHAGDQVSCGSVKINEGTLPDPCRTRAQVDPNGLDGMSASSLWVVDKGFLAIGLRHPGSAYPMVGLVHGRTWVWKSDVPLGNPLLAKGTPGSTLSNGKIYLSYDAGQDTFVTAFDATTGHRDWHVPFVRNYVPGIWASRDTVFAFASTPNTLVGFAADTGAVRFSLNGK